MAWMKAANQREKEVKEQLHVFAAMSSFSREVAINDTNLPTVKKERIELFGGLNYANEDIYSFIERLEFVFKHTLTLELVVTNDSDLIDLVYKALNTEELVVKVISISVKILLMWRLLVMLQNISHKLIVRCKVRILLVN